jgi:hypothetical protein
MDNTLFKFDIEITGDVVTTSCPIFDDMSRLLGAFSLIKGNTIHCVVSQSDYPASLLISSDMPFYFTPVETKSDNRLFVTSGIISETKLNERSEKVLKTLKELA